ncbi:class I adenylate-forming enzyme family protein [Rhodococcus erythropolis]|uniref:class I adenylate-forming enzyme family protein n=1 Tax=Rhodococcus erythropolis TaxID=1833 RepID=UPI00222663C4|nr:class I adenylate-forming enzyme family protein [Rhodococcus erythropolis]MCW2295423.1 fatty-acyl-CoA synthase [Rhodococcus erythropolis]
MSTVDINWILDSPRRALPVGDANTVALSIEGRDSFTYEQLGHRRDQWVTFLLEQGVQRGDRVGIMLLNTLDYIALYFAIAKVGAIAVRLNYRLTSDELLFIVDDAGCSLLVLHSSRIGQITAMVDRSANSNWAVVVDDETETPSWAANVDISSLPETPYAGPSPVGSDPVMLMYSSGTTGRPKGVLWTHDQVLWLALMQATAWGFDQNTIALTTGPFYHAGAFEVLLLPTLFVHGTAVGMGSGGVTTTRILQAIEHSNANTVTLFTFNLYELLRGDQSSDKYLANVKWLMSGGDVLHEWAVKEFDARFPGIELGQGYGLTEGGTMSTYLDHEHRLSHAGTVGRPFVLTDVEVRDDAGQEVPAGDVGEIWIRSNNMSPGYWKRPEANVETFVDGWCATGDLGEMTPDGFLKLAGRKKDMIRSGGENVYPAEVETVLLAHPSVQSAAVVAVPDVKFMEVGCAVVVPVDDAEDSVRLEAELRAYLRERLAGYKCPRHYTFLTELPLNHSGKIQKNLLRNNFAHLGSIPDAPPSTHERSRDQEVIS